MKTRFKFLLFIINNHHHHHDHRVVAHRKERERKIRDHRCTNWCISHKKLNELWNRKVEICNIIKYFKRNCDDHGNGDRFIYDLACSDESRFNAHNYIASPETAIKATRIHIRLCFCEHFIVWFVDLFLIAGSSQTIFAATKSADHDDDDRRQQSMAETISIDFRCIPFYFSFVSILSNCDFESRVCIEIERWRGHGANTIILWHFVFRKNKIEAQTTKAAKWTLFIFTHKIVSVLLLFVVS